MTRFGIRWLDERFDRAVDEIEEEAEIERGATGLIAFLGGVGVGVGLMYLLDPERGAQRRSWMRDKAVHWRHRIADAAEATSRDVAQRTRGLVARTRSRFRHEDVPDDTLVERVRAEMGRKVSHPRAIDVTAEQGVVTLRGPVFASEADRLLACVERVPGVEDVVNELEVHATAIGVPALQGGSELEPPIAWWARGWTPSDRLAAGVVGAGCVAYGARARGLAGAGLGVLGGALLFRAITNVPARSGRRRSRSEGSGNGAHGNGADPGLDGARDGDAAGSASTG